MTQNFNKIKPEILKALEEQSGIITLACAKAGIGRKTFYRWMEKNKKFAKEVEETIREAKKTRLDLAESKHVQKLRDGETKAVYFELERRHPEYRQKIETEVQDKAAVEELKKQTEILKKIGEKKHDNKRDVTTGDEAGNKGSEGDSSATLQKQ